MKANLRTLCLMACLFLATEVLHAGGPASGAGMSAILPRFDDVQDASLWRLGGNAAGVRLDTTNISEAFLGGDYSFGDLRGSSEAPTLWTAGASARTLKHTKKFSMAGTFSFRQFTTYNHCGSMLLYPERYPVDIYEFTPGTKSRQRYALSGVVGVDVAPGWVVGAGLGFESQNCAKLKDLRYTMYYLDFSLTPSVLYRAGKWVVGASFLYERNTQSVESKRIGENGTEYRAFLEKGNGRGVEGLWTAGNLLLDVTGVNRFPIDENAFGGALQLQYGSFLVEGQYRHRAGRIGEKQQVWFNYTGDEVLLRLALNVRGGHFLRMGLGYTDRRNSEHILENITSGGVTTTTRLGTLPVFAERSLSLEPSYYWISGAWRVDATGRALFRESLSTQMYPTRYRESELDLFARLAGRYTLSPAAVKAPLWDFSLGLSFQRGRFPNLAEDKDVLVVPDSLGDWYMRDILVRTRPVLGVDASVRCRLKMGLWIDLSVDYRQGFGFSLLPTATPYRLTSALSVGYSF